MLVTPLQPIALAALRPAAPDLSAVGWWICPGQRGVGANARNSSLTCLARRAPCPSGRGPPRAPPTSRESRPRPSSTAWCARRSRPSSRTRAKRIPRRCRATSSANCAGTCAAASSRSASLAATATRAAGTCSWPSRARAAASARAAPAGAWPTPPPTWSTASCPTCPCGSSCSRCPTSCACSRRSSPTCFPRSPASSWRGSSRATGADPGWRRRSERSAGLSRSCSASGAA